MDLIDDLRLRVRWTWHRATFVAQTEGVAALVERTAAMLGVGAVHVQPEELLVGPPLAPLSQRSAQAWPASLLLLSATPEDQGRGLQLAGLAHRLGVPAHLADGPADVAGELQMSSTLIVVGISAWPSPTILDEARRLRQVVVVALDDRNVGDDRLPAIAARCDRLIVLDAGSVEHVTPRIPEETAVHVVPPDQDEATLAALDALLAATREGATR